MPTGESRAPAEVARWDQVDAAERAALAVLTDIAPDRQRWAPADELITGTIERLVVHLASQPPTSGLVCPHALGETFDAGPRLLILDAARGLLACERCYPALAAQWPDDVACFECGRLVGGFVWHDLFVAYGPILAVAALCARCRDWAPAGGLVSFCRDN